MLLVISWNSFEKKDKDKQKNLRLFRANEEIAWLVCDRVQDQHLTI